MERTAFFIGAGGGIFEMDVPDADSMARERWDQQIEKGELRELDPDQVRWDEYTYGADKNDKPLVSRRLVLVTPDDDTPAKPARSSKPPKAAPAKPPKAAKVKTPAAPPAEDDAARAGLLAQAKDLGIDVDPTLSIEDLTAAIGV